MIPEVDVLRAESESLQSLLAGFAPADWDRVTPFKRWTVWDVVAHLFLSDQWALASAGSRKEFGEAASHFLSALKGGISLTTYTRKHFEHLPGPAILPSWRQCSTALTEKLVAIEPNARLAWFGPDMGVRSFVTARYMETWAHGQDVYDLLGRQRPYTDAIHAIATLGVKTFAFTFANRREPPPAPEPYVRLIAPSGAIWEWNTPSEIDSVEGLASDFCHVVTQNRNVVDTGLRVRGAAAQRWMAIAQCFAGPPEQPPTPGSRTGVMVNSS